MLARDGGCGMRDVTHVLLDILMVGKIHVSYIPRLSVSVPKFVSVMLVAKTCSDKCLILRRWVKRKKNAHFHSITGANLSTNRPRS